MADCPLADDCPEFSEQISGMGCQHYGDRGGAEWCNHYNMPINELKQQPVKPGEEVTVDVTDIHESGAGVGRTEEGFIVLVDGVLPDARATVKIHTVKDSHANAKEVLDRGPIPDEEEDEEGEAATAEATDGEGEDRADSDDRSDADRERLGSRDNFWGG